MPHPNLGAIAERELLAADPRKPTDWNQVAVYVAVATNLVLGVAAFATVKADLANLRAEVPPGSIARLDERTALILKAIEHKPELAR